MKSCFLVLSVLAVTYAAPRANDLKYVSIEDNEIPVKKVKGVSAEFGGFRAAAGLGGSEAGGALFAKAEAPSASANAGLYGGAVGGGSGASAVSASEYGSYGNGQVQGGGFFDRIFAIPINVLHSVNSYVQTKNGPRRVHYHHGDGVGASAGAGVNGVEAGAGVGAGAEAGAGASAGAGVGASAGVGGDSGLRFSGGESGAGASASASAGGVSVNGRPGAKPDYDKIFNVRDHDDRKFQIPITALKSVNDFLNG